MSITRICDLGCEETNAPWADDGQPRWYAAYTRPHHEKRVADQMDRRKIERFLPLYDSVRRWSDRRVRLQFPLFPGYVFVHVPLRDVSRVLQIQSVVRLVGSNGLPTAVPDDEIGALRDGLTCQLRAEPHPYLDNGRRVRIVGGPLAGKEGIVLRRKGKSRVVLSLDLIMRSIAVEVDPVDLIQC